MPAWSEAFCKIYQRPQKPAFAAAVEELHATLPDGAPRPSVAQVRRWYRTVSAVDRAPGRLGPNALKSVRAFVRRDTSELLPTDVYVSDGHTFDAEVAHPRHGQPFRPELTCVIDWKTRKLVGWSAAVAESTWAVADALRHAVETHGIPAVYYADHGPGQENRLICAMLARLKVREARSLPRNSQARGMIERFNQYLIREARRLPTYMGKDMDKDAANRVFRISRREIRLIGTSRLLLAWDDFLAFVADAIEAYNTAHHHRALPKLRDPDTGRVRHMTPAEAWQAAMADGWEPMLVGEEEATDLFRPYEIRKTHRGEIALHGKRYFHPDLEHLHGDEVLVGYDIHDPSKVWVRDLDERLVAIAGLDANSQPAFPKSVIEQARENRAHGRLKRLEARRAEAIAELEGPAPTVDYDAGWTPERQARLEDLRARRAAAVDHRVKPEGDRGAAPRGDRGTAPADGESDEDRFWRRATAIEAAIAAGEAVSDDDRAWLERARGRPWYLARRRLETFRASRAS